MDKVTKRRQGKTMKIVKTAIVTSILALSSTSAFAASSAVQSDVTRQVHVVKAPVLIETGVYAPKTTKRRVKRVVIEPVESLAARDASTSDNSPFVYKLGKRENTKTKTFRPAASKSDAMPNLFKK